jgi:hypothetical protein
MTVDSPSTSPSDTGANSIELAPGQAERAQRQVIMVLEANIVEMRQAISQLPEPQTLIDAFHQLSDRVDLRKRELMLEKARKGDLHFQRPNAPLGTKRSSLYILFGHVARTAMGEPVDAVARVHVGEDAELDQLVRSSHETLIAVAEEAVGAFNNLPLDVRIERASRIRDAITERTKANSAQEQGRLTELLAQLGLHEWTEPAEDRPELVVSPRLLRTRQNW